MYSTIRRINLPAVLKALKIRLTFQSNAEIGLLRTIVEHKLLNQKILEQIHKCTEHIRKENLCAVESVFAGR